MWTFSVCQFPTLLTFLTYSVSSLTHFSYLTSVLICFRKGVSCAEGRKMLWSHHWRKLRTKPMDRIINIRILKRVGENILKLSLYKRKETQLDTFARDFLKPLPKLQWKGITHLVSQERNIHSKSYLVYARMKDCHDR